MTTTVSGPTSPQRIRLGHFLVPAKHAAGSSVFEKTSIAVIIPTYQPDELTLRLVIDVTRYAPQAQVYVVDDHSARSSGSDSIFARITNVSRNVMLLRTPDNRMKAGALNFALQEILRKTDLPDAILTLDDDVFIEEKTIRNVVVELMRHESLGAVCSQSGVYNKNKNFLTRLQGLEYLGFNAIRLSDEGFFRGPLVMHGMLTAFRGKALREVGGFADGHLIEDYEITMRLKAHGWSVKSAVNAPAWTVVPETFSGLWRQRTRWLYGGITVVTRAPRVTAIFQDILGHSLFLSTLLMIGVLFFARGSGYVPPFVAETVIILSFAQLTITYLFQVWLMRLYVERDGWDWVIRLLLVPEFVYSYFMTIALLGSYMFHSFTVLRQHAGSRSGPLFSRAFLAGERFFGACGYTERQWSTRNITP